MTIHLGGKPVGPGHPCYIIAEIGPNFCVSADPERNEREMMALIRVAASAGADAVKLQLKGFGPGSYYGREGNLDRELGDTRSPFRTRREYVTAREPSDDLLWQVDRECARLGLAWSVSPWDVESVERLRFHVPPWLKVASASLTDPGLLEAMAGVGVPLVISTGMSTEQDISDALDVVEAYDVPYALLHCLSTYPAPEGECNLYAMRTLRARWGCPTGWSGHERGLQVTIAAVALGADIVERHITMDRTAWGPDHASSLEPRGFRQLVRDIRLVESAMGDGVKVPMPSEMAARERLRRVG